MALFVVTYVDFLADGDPGKALRELIRYGSDTSQAAGQLSYTVLQQIDRPNRFATLEVWDSVTDYNNWQTDHAHDAICHQSDAVARLPV